MLWIKCFSIAYRIVFHPGMNANRRLQKCNTCDRKKGIQEQLWIIKWAKPLNDRKVIDVTRDTKTVFPYLNLLHVCENCFFCISLAFPLGYTINACLRISNWNEKNSLEFLFHRRGKHQQTSISQCNERKFVFNLQNINVIDLSVNFFRIYGIWTYYRLLIWTKYRWIFW